MQLLDIDMRFMDESFAGATTGDYILCVLIIAMAILLKRPIGNLLSNISHKLARRISHEHHRDVFKDLLRNPLEWLILSILCYIGIDRISTVLNSIMIIHHSDKGGRDISLGDVVDHIFLLSIIISTTLILSRLIDFIYHIHSERAYRSENKERQQLLPLIKEVIKLVVWTISIFWILGTVFHVNIPALITGLGIGGIAIALAAKESVENLFAAFTILSDKPFQVGDHIKLGGMEGHVERIGFRSTRIRSKEGSAFIIPNQKLVSENLENISNCSTKIIHQAINIKYGLPHEQLLDVIKELKDAANKDTDIDGSAQVVLEKFGENVFQLELTYKLPKEACARDKEVKQRMNMRAYEVLSQYTSKNAVSISETKETKTDENIDETKSKKDDDGLLGIL